MKNKLYISRNNNYQWVNGADDCYCMVLEFGHKNTVKIKQIAEKLIKLIEKTYVIEDYTLFTISVYFSYKHMETVFQIINLYTFEVSDELMQIKNQYDTIINNKSDYKPSIEFSNGKYILKNVKENCQQMFYQNFGEITPGNFKIAIQKLKEYGYFIDHQRESETLTDRVISTPSTRIEIDPTLYSIKELVKMMDNLNQWPAVFIVDYENSLSVIQQIHSHIQHKKSVVFFRPDSTDQLYLKEFKDFVVSNSLNSYIDETVDAVFISKNKIPKPLIRSSFKPTSVVLFSKHEYGKLLAYINNIPIVYYYNSSLVKGKVPGGKIINVL